MQTSSLIQACDKVNEKPYTATSASRLLLKPAYPWGGGGFAETAARVAASKHLDFPRRIVVVAPVQSCHRSLEQLQTLDQRMLTVEHSIFWLFFLGDSLSHVHISAVVTLRCSDLRISALLTLSNQIEQAILHKNLITAAWDLRSQFFHP